MALNYYHVEARFQKARFFYKTEFWQGMARNPVIATRRAIKEIMKRKNVQRLRHHKITFMVEKITPAREEILPAVPHEEHKS